MISAVGEAEMAKNNVEHSMVAAAFAAVAISILRRMPKSHKNSCFAYYSRNNNHEFSMCHFSNFFGWLFLYFEDYINRYKYLQNVKEIRKVTITTMRIFVKQ